MPDLKAYIVWLSSERRTLVLIYQIDDRLYRTYRRRAEGFNVNRYHRDILANYPVSFFPPPRVVSTGETFLNPEEQKAFKAVVEING